MPNVSIYQINTRAFCYKQNKALLQIPLEYFRKLKSLGIDYVWMMGVWEPLSKKYVDNLPGFGEVELYLYKDVDATANQVAFFRRQGNREGQ